MKKLLVILFMFPYWLCGQELAFSIKTDTTWIETTGSGTIARVNYIWTDTVIYSRNNEEKVVKSSVNKEILDSLSSAIKIYGEIKKNYDYYGIYEASKINFLRNSNFYRNLLTSLFGEDTYRTNVVNAVRNEMQGKYVFIYNRERYVLTADENGRFTDNDNNLVLVTAPLSSYWTIITNRLNNNEKVEFYSTDKILWRGQGELGGAILRKLD